MALEKGVLIDMHNRAPAKEPFLYLLFVGVILLVVSAVTQVTVPLTSEVTSLLVIILLQGAALARSFIEIIDAESRIISLPKAVEASPAEAQAFIGRLTVVREAALRRAATASVFEARRPGLGRFMMRKTPSAGDALFKRASLNPESAPLSRWNPWRWNPAWPVDVLTLLGEENKACRTLSMVLRAILLARIPLCYALYQVVNLQVARKG